MKYLNGQEVPKEVEAALLLILKTGFITRTLWNKHFFNGNPRWASKRLRAMQVKKLIAVHPNPLASDCFVLTSLGKRTLGAQFMSPPKPPPISQLLHDELVVDSLLSLRKARCITDWTLESDLKARGDGKFILNGTPEGLKYPDAIFKMTVQGGERLCAFEYERQEKSIMRYRTILRRYAVFDSLWMILIVCGNSGVHRRITNQIAALRDPFLMNRVGIVDIESWQKSPSMATILLGTRRFSMAQLCALAPKL